MNASIELLSLCQTLHEWYQDGTLFARLFSWILSVNVLVLCALLGARYLATVCMRHWREWRRMFKGRDFIYNLEECPICFQDFCDPVRLPCGHVNCLKCVSDYCRHIDLYGGNYRCSLCREPIRDIYYLDGYTPSTLPHGQRTRKLNALKGLIRPHIKTIQWINAIRWGMYIVVYFMAKRLIQLLF